MKTTTKASETVKVERFVNGGEWVRFETVDGCEYGTLHNSMGDKGTFHVVDIEHRKTLMQQYGWTKAA